MLSKLVLLCALQVQTHPLKTRLCLQNNTGSQGLITLTQQLTELEPQRKAEGAEKSGP